MIDPQPVVEISRPSFAELSSSMAKSGHADHLSEDGTIVFGNLQVAATDRRSPVRFAAQLADMTDPDPDAPAYEDDKVRITTRCRDGKVHLIVHDILNARSETVVIPTKAIPAVAADLIDCMTRDSTR